MQAAAQIARRMIGEGRESLVLVPENRYVSGLRAIADHLIGRIDRLA